MFKICLKGTVQHYISTDPTCNWMSIPPLFDAAEHRRSGSRFLRRPGIWRQHQGSSDSSRSDGDDCLRQGILHSQSCLPRHLPGELRRRWPHHNLLRRTQPQNRGGFRQNRQSTRSRHTLPPGPIFYHALVNLSHDHVTQNQHWMSLFVQTIEQLENELLNGQKLQGPATASEVHQILEQKNMLQK